MNATDRRGHRRVVKITRSPSNGSRWCITLDCGHEHWITRLTRPRPKLAWCTTCQPKLEVSTSLESPWDGGGE